MTTISGPQLEREALQRRTMRVLVTSQVLGGVGVGSGIAVIALLAYDLSGTASLSGLAPTAMTIGAALAAAMIARVAVSTGRRRGLVAGYLIGVVGAVLAIVAAIAGSYAVHIVASVAFGAASAANLQARYAATDLAADDRRAGALSTVVWATTVGAVLGPNLTGPGGDVAAMLGLPPLAGPYLFSVASFASAALVQAIFLRPDPLQFARHIARDDDAIRDQDGELAPPSVIGAVTPRDRPLRRAITTIRAVPAALAAFVAIGAAHATMVAVMVMTPVHMEDHGATLSLVGLTISLHIAGMYALSPVFGRLADAVGRPAVILLGCGQLVAAALLAATAAPTGARMFPVALVLLGTGWSCCLVAGSAMLTDALDVADRPAAQGASDLVMNLSGAVGGTIAGIVLAIASYEALAFGAVVIVITPVWLTLRASRTMAVTH
ncbi:MAG: MFS transporter [Nitriliruptoraceae bacterium]